MAKHNTVTTKGESSAGGLPLPTEWARPIELFEGGVAKGNFTAWSCAGSAFVASCFFADEIVPPLEGNCDWQTPLHPIFDLASLSKPLFMNALVRRSFQGRNDAIFQPLVDLLSHPTTASGTLIAERLRSTASTLTLADFLNHRTGVKPWTWMGRCLWAFDNPESQEFAKAPLYPQKPGAWQTTLATQLTQHLVKGLGREATSECYSDIGYGLLARILEALPNNATEPFSWEAALAKHNALLGTEFLHAALHGDAVKNSIPFYPYWRLYDQPVPPSPTNDYEFGLVNDTNANLLAAEKVVSGHAGLFGTINDVLAGTSFLARTQVGFSENQRTRHPRFSVGLDTPTSADSSAGVREWPLAQGEEICGHLGFSGTAFWFQLRENQHAGTQCLLTNRTARRTAIGYTDNARVLVVEPAPKFHWEGEQLIRESGGETLHFVQRKAGGPWMRMARNDVEELIVARHRASHLIWDKQTLRAIPNINAIRREGGKLLW
jgi:CubicO group peptidase (beta-lactamase class C family)